MFSPNETLIDYIPISEKMKKKELKRNKTPSSSHISAIKDWTDYDITFSSPNKRPKYKNVSPDLGQKQPIPHLTFRRTHHLPRTCHLHVVKVNLIGVFVNLINSLISPKKSDTPYEH